MNQNESSRIYRTFSALTAVIIISKLAGFIKQIVIAWAFGASTDTDLLQISQSLVGDIEYVILQTLSTAFVALYIHIREADSIKAKEFISNITKTLIMIAVVVSTVLAVCSSAVSKIIAPSYDAEISSKLAKYITVFSPAVLLSVLSALFISVLNANKRFIPGEIKGMIQSVVVILTVILLKDRLSVNALAVGILIYSVINPLFYGWISKEFIHLTKGSPFSDTHVREFLALCAPLMLGYSMLLINQLVDKIIVSGMNPGTITAMVYGHVLYNLVTAFITALCTVLFTSLTELNSQRDIVGASRMAEKASVIMIMALIPTTVVVCFASKEIVTLAFGRGAFDQQAIQATSLSLIGYGTGLIGFAVKSLYAGALYSVKDTKSPMLNSTVGVAVNIFFSIVLSRIIGVLGVTIASSIAEYVAAVLNIASWRKASGSYEFLIKMKDIITIIISAIICAFSVSVVLRNMSIQSNALRLGVSTILCFTAFFLCTLPVIRNLNFLYSN